MALIFKIITAILDFLKIFKWQQYQKEVTGTQHTYPEFYPPMQCGGKRRLKTANQIRGPPHQQSHEHSVAFLYLSLI
ncbi:MAG: hypothetical protein ACI9BF_000901 [Candidatus Paceibacteria bacterium]|jgi:hypothetical protein